MSSDRRSLRVVAAVFCAALATALISPTTIAAPPTPVSVAPFAAKKPSASKAASYLAKSTPKKWTSAATALDVGLGLATTGCSYVKTVKSIRTYLKKKAKSYATTAAAAGKLAIFAVAVGDNPKSFGGVNLVTKITTKTSASGQVDGHDFSFGQALAMVGLARSGKKPSSAMVGYLVGQQHSDGGFGYGSGASDPDYTALALLALSPRVITPTAETASAATRAKGWAAANQTSAGYWQNYSPVDSTGLLGSALRLHGVDTAKSRAWLGTKQLSSGGFANTLTGKKADRLATAEALYLITGKSLVTLSTPVKKCSK
jgi:hypothetical protein